MKSFFLCAATMVGMSGCVYTTANLTPVDGALKPMEGAKNAQSIMLTETERQARPYKIVGNISVIARSVNLLSPDPTKDDVNQKMRAEAARLGADAVIGIRYRTEDSGLASQGKMIGEGVAIIFD